MSPADNGRVVEHDQPLRALIGQGRVLAECSLAELTLLPPIHAQEIWCAGVTYQRSRAARLEESTSGAGDIYAQVYEADRRELFLEDAAMRRTVGPEAAIGLRSDSSWALPEPELGVVLGSVQREEN